MGCQSAKEESEIIVDSAVTNAPPTLLAAKEESEIIVDSSVTNAPPTLLAWSSSKNNNISVIDLETKQNYVTFDGASVSSRGKYVSINMPYWIPFRGRRWTHIKEIPNTKLLVSLNHDLLLKSANMEIFDISKKGKANKIYSLGEVSGSKLGVGLGDVTYNSRRSILGAIPVVGRIAYHLFAIDTGASNAGGIVKLNRKTRWSPYYETYESNFVASFDFNPAGESIATMDRYGVCLISDVNTNNNVFHLRVARLFEDVGCCRWSTNMGEPLLFVKYDYNRLNILDVEKKVLTLSNPVGLNWACWIDVCQSNGNLLASGSYDKIIRIFDKRESKIVKTFEGVHSSRINCVRWNPSGDMIASTSWDNTAKLLDFKTGTVLHTGATSDENDAYSVCFI